MLSQPQILKDSASGSTHTFLYNGWLDLSLKRGFNWFLDPEAAELAAGSRPEKNYGLAAEKNAASRKPAEKKMRLSRHKIIWLAEKLIRNTTDRHSV